LAVAEQPKADFGFDPLLVQYAAWALYAVGMTLVVSSSIRLGITGTYCGDYFGILMKERVTGFPFNVVEGTVHFPTPIFFLGWCPTCTESKTCATSLQILLPWSL
jgi:methylene-fatty-acyl-phospholipid synthase